ncbi:MAG TPA: NAD(P)/FAD-dependent oxidoreductase [Rhizomicrobium sp.]|nr:NAD(P)/FAD-dependent oxidoreductase [Rhizomicrobium sp.]
MSARAHDAVVVGAGVNGLVAAAYLAKAGKRVVIVEARNRLGGLCETAPLHEGFSAPAAAHTLYALDARIVKELKLARNGLAFAARDLALAGLRSAGKHIVIHRDVHATVRNLAVHSQADADAWSHFRNELFMLARALRPLWWDAAAAKPLSRASSEKLDRLKRLSAVSWLDSWFECDALKAVLAFDASADGFSPFEPGSVLLLLWRAAQEMCGLQGAVAVPTGGPGALTSALSEAVRALGVEIQTGAHAAKLVIADGRAAGVTLASGETLPTTIALSSLSRRWTLGDLAPAGAAGLDAAAALGRDMPRTGQAKVLLALSALPAFSGIAVPRQSRFIVADRLETYAAASSAAQAGRLSDELAIEFVVPSAADPALAPPGQHIVSALVRPVPVATPADWAAMKAPLVAKVVAALEPHAGGLARHIVAAQVLTPADIAQRYGRDDEAGSADRVLSGWNARVTTPIDGLFLCGAEAEPVGAISGRAGRIAAALALRAEVER